MDTTTPETAAHRIAKHVPHEEHDTDGDDVDPHAPVRIFIDVTQKDPELRTIEATLILMDPLGYETQVRVLRYLQDRLAVSTAPAPAAVSRHEVAQALAESDGRDWHSMTPTHQSPYYRRAEALTALGCRIVRFEP